MLEALKWLFRIISRRRKTDRRGHREAAGRGYPSCRDRSPNSSGNSLQKYQKYTRQYTRRQPTLPLPSDYEKKSISARLEENRQTLRRIFPHASDLVYREISIGNKKPHQALLAYIDNLTNCDLLHRDIIYPLAAARNHLPSDLTARWVKEHLLSPGKIAEQHRWAEVIEAIVRGGAVIFLEGESKALIATVPEDVSRGVNKPLSETTVRGPADAFNERLCTNIALVRRRLATPYLAVEYIQIGQSTKIQVAILYLLGKAQENTVREVKKRLHHIHRTDVISSGQIEELIQDHPYSVFSTIHITERPDRIVGNLLEGKVALLVDNTPFAMIVPATLASMLQSPEDYYNRYWFSSFIRILRWFSLVAALLVPSIYIAITSYHHELVPTVLLVSIVASREGVPFPAVAEALLMEIAFETLREAGVRLPAPFGQTLSIVGALIIGQTAVSAGLVSTVMVVVVALTAIASYTIPTITLANSIRTLRFLMMIAAAFLGMFGVMVGLVLIMFHLCSLNSFGVPFLSPLAPLNLSDLKDAMVRLPNRLRRKEEGQQHGQPQNT